MAVVLRGPQAGTAIKLGIGRKLEGPIMAVRCTRQERDRVMEAWQAARKKGAKAAKANGKATTNGRSHDDTIARALDALVPAAASPALDAPSAPPLVEDNDGAPYPDPAGLPTAYLARCIVEARRRVRESSELRDALDVGK